MAALNRNLVQRRLRLKAPIDDTTRTRIAALPGVCNAVLKPAGNQLEIEYDLRKTTFENLLAALRACAVYPVDTGPTRIRRWLAVWREHNRRRHLLKQTGWYQYLQSAFLHAADYRDGVEQSTPRRHWQRFLNEDGRPPTGTS